MSAVLTLLKNGVAEALAVALAELRETWYPPLLLLSSVTVAILTVATVIERSRLLAIASGATDILRICGT